MTIINHPANLNSPIMITTVWYDLASKFLVIIARDEEGVVKMYDGHAHSSY